MQDDVTKPTINALLSRSSSKGELIESLALCSAKLNMPRRSEHFISDIHGDFERFSHILQVGSGVIKFAIDNLYASTLEEPERLRLLTLICLRQNLMSNDGDTLNLDDFCRLTEIASFFCRQHSRSYVTKKLRGDFSTILEMLVYAPASIKFRDHCQPLFVALNESGGLSRFVDAVAAFIRRVSAPKLHVLGDIYDRGPDAESVLDLLMRYGDVDVQWGNHDIIWMGAALGNLACMANAVRISLRYGNTSTLEQGYGISLRELAHFSLSVYSEDPCNQFRPMNSVGESFAKSEMDLIAKMHKAITVIQFKLEAQVIHRHPEYNMDSRLLLDKIEVEKERVNVDGRTYCMLDTFLPTVREEAPYDLSDEEVQLIDNLKSQFTSSRRLKKHTDFLFESGGMYRVSNNCLHFHGCIPLNNDGTFKAYTHSDRVFHGRGFFDLMEASIRKAYRNRDLSHVSETELDIFWYLWTGPCSPLFGKEKMATFERYFVSDKDAHKEPPNAYYKFRDNERVIKQILREFGVNTDHGFLVNGHVPVKVRRGERPVKANGKLVVIDGGMSAAYQKQTGIGGYTLISNANGVFLVEHAPNNEGESITHNFLNQKLECVTLYDQPALVKESEEGIKISRKIRVMQSLIEKNRHQSEVELVALVQGETKEI